jgi:hypothetical protein
MTTIGHVTIRMPAIHCINMTCDMLIAYEKKLTSYGHICVEMPIFN